MRHSNSFGHLRNHSFGEWVVFLSEPCEVLQFKNYLDTRLLSQSIFDKFDRVQRISVSTISRFMSFDQFCNVADRRRAC